ncbi:DMT family transporter [Rhodoplanes sp. TEM]|uniref:DMT family transporter n=1 Tax=Rhodoplanes tepidamans TaxID=200616 RepID=A0ABT5JAC2_RHOTP|nr:MULTISPECIES: DMT family transporter [Rhodoplanes]MDC7786631.1 DMT family transporter [Rhodoplanes tepidamans]MDC7983022.1 DMT family transporter [Rhodoplanes sp. TEM]MDQ0356404.1 drug/metabolite transporter (DMT)-like permease [Rhodoplanes tepidamans]
MSVSRAILIKIVSVALFALMSALVRYVGEAGIPLGQVVFFRSAFALILLVAMYAVRRELAVAVRTRRPLGHVGRGSIAVFGMFLNFAALARLPLVDATAISFAAPMITVALAALVLSERVRAYRWTAVAIGFGGVLVMLWPYLGLGRLVTAGSAEATVGALCALGAAFSNAFAVIQTRRLTDSETTPSIVFYFSLICTIAGAVVLPFVWMTPTLPQLAALIAIGILGGLSHLLLTESYRYAPASVMAPFDYLALLFAFLIGWAAFGEIPTVWAYGGAGIVVLSGLFVIWRERQLAARRRQTPPPRLPPPGDV